MAPGAPQQNHTLLGWSAQIFAVISELTLANENQDNLVIVVLAEADKVKMGGEPVNFYTVVESARRRGEVARGYRIKAHSGDAAKAYGVRVNPKKSERVTFAEADKVIVLAES